MAPSHPPAGTDHDRMSRPRSAQDTKSSVGRAVTRLERLVRIDRLLRARSPVPMRRFVDELEVSRSTITRDLEYLRDRLQAPLVYDAAANGHRYDPDAADFQLPGFWLNQSELYALLATEQLLESIQPGLLAPHLGPLKARVRRLLGESGQNAELVGDRIRLLESGNRAFDSDEFSVVAEAVLTTRRLCFEYHGRARDAVSQRTVDPQRLIHYRSNWYLVAVCEKAGALRMFSLDRIHHSRVLEATATLLGANEVERWVGASYGIFTGTAERWAHLRFTATAARWAAEERWHPDQLGVWAGDHYELQVPYANPTELVMEILRYGADVEVLDPPDLRADVAQRLRQALANYQ